MSEKVSYNLDVSANLEPLKQMKGLLQQIQHLKKQVFGETKELPTYCMACGEYIGTFILAAETMATIKTRPLCDKCFKEKVGEMVMPKNPHIY